MMGGVVMNGKSVERKGGILKDDWWVGFGSPRGAIKTKV